MNAEGTIPRRRAVRHYTAEQRERLKKEWQASGKTRGEFCAERGVNVTTFHGWFKKKPKKTSVKKQKLARVELTPGLSGNVTEVVLPNGCRVHNAHALSGTELIALVKELAKC